MINMQELKQFESQLKIGSVVRAKFTNNNNAYSFQAKVVKINDKSVRVMSNEKIEGYPLNYTFSIALSNNTTWTHNNGVFPYNSEDSYDTNKVAEKTSIRTLNEAMPTLRKIVSEHSYQKIDGMIVDGYSASAVTQVYDHLGQENKQKFGNVPFDRAISMAFKMLNKQRCL